MVRVKHFAHSMLIPELGNPGFIRVTASMTRSPRLSRDAMSVVGEFIDQEV